LYFSIIYDNTGKIMMKIPNFAVFEGGDGSGTTTQLNLLARRFSGGGEKRPAQGRAVENTAYARHAENAAVPGKGKRSSGRRTRRGPVFFPTCEPTGGPVGKLIRSALRKEIALLPETLARLFAADRAEHLYTAGGVLDRARRGELVVCDRYILSSLVYQGLECGEELPRALNASFPLPEQILFFDVDPQIAAERLRGRSSLELYEYREFQEKARERYRALVPLFRDQGVIVEVIDAARPLDEVAETVWRALRNMPILGEGGGNLKA
jgi:dTMP kinase